MSETDVSLKIAIPERAGMDRSVMEESARACRRAIAGGFLISAVLACYRIPVERAGPVDLSARRPTIAHCDRRGPCA
jgi:hypothetical protein